MSKDAQTISSSSQKKDLNIKDIINKYSQDKNQEEMIKDVRELVIALAEKGDNKGINSALDALKTDNTDLNLFNFLGDSSVMGGGDSIVRALDSKLQQGAKETLVNYFKLHPDYLNQSSSESFSTSDTSQVQVDETKVAGAGADTQHTE